MDSAPGRGASFDIFLPQYRSNDLTAIKAHSVEVTVEKDLTGMGTILVVEDEDPVRTFATRGMPSPVSVTVICT